jgi:hypothetical protein
MISPFPWGTIPKKRIVPMRSDTFWRWHDWFWRVYDWAVRLGAVGFITAVVGGGVIGGLFRFDGWDAPVVLLAALIGFAVVAIIYIAFCLFWDRRNRKRLIEPATESETQHSAPIPDVDARQAFFQILEKSEWRANQLANPPDPKTRRYDWLKIRLETEIHNYLAQNRLTAWGETNLPPGRGTGPQRKIKPEEWEQSKILFDDLDPNIPRTMAKWINNDRGSLFGIMFSKAQIFRLFPLASSNEWTPIHLGIQYLSNKIGDTNTGNCLEQTRHALRQAAYEKRVKIRGRKQLANKRVFGNTNDYSSIFTDVENAYWANSNINALATSPDFKKSYHTEPETAYAWGKLGVDERNRYAELMINWSDLIREWP